MGILASTRTAQHIVVAVQRQFGDESNVQVTIEDIIRWINQGQYEILANNPVTKAVATTGTIAGTFTYPLTDLNILNIQSIQIGGSPCKYMNFQDAESYIAAEDPKRSATGKPDFWYEWGGSVYFYPTPALTLANNISIFYTSAPTLVSSQSDALSVPDTYFNALLKYVLAQAYELDEDWNASQLSGQAFTSAVTRLSEDENTVYVNAYPMLTISPEDM